MKRTNGILKLLTSWAPPSNNLQDPKLSVQKIQLTQTEMRRVQVTKLISLMFPPPRKAGAPWSSGCLHKSCADSN